MSRRILRRIGAEQIVGFHRHGGEAANGGGQGGGKMLFAVDDLGPEGLLLGRVEQEASIEVAFLPGRAGEGLPVNNVGRGPGGESFGATPAMELGLDGAGGTIAGGDHKSAIAQPCVEFGP